MTSHSCESDAIKQICNNVKRLGYGPGQRIRLYGEEFEVISDPYPEADGIAVSVKTTKGREIRALQLPTTVLGSVRIPSAA